MCECCFPVDERLWEALGQGQFGFFLFLGRIRGGGTGGAGEEECAASLRKGIFVQASLAAPCQGVGCWWETGFALEPVPGRSVKTLLPVPLEKTGGFDVVGALTLAQGAWPLAAHASPMHTPQTATACSSAHMGQASYITDLGLLQHYFMLIHFALSETTPSGKEWSHLPRATPGHRLRFPGIAGAPLLQPRAPQGRQCSCTQPQRRLCSSLRVSGWCVLWCWLFVQSCGCPASPPLGRAPHLSHGGHEQ